MKLRSKKLTGHCQSAVLRRGLKALGQAFALFAFTAMPVVTWAADKADLFDAVPAGDATYGQISQLVKADLLPSGSDQGSLTRFEVAELVWKAEKKYKEIVVADSDMELPPSPPDETGGSSSGDTPLPPSEGETSSSSGTQVSNAPHQAPKALATPDYMKYPESLAQAEASLRTLEQTYELELSVVQQQKESLTEQVSQAESDQYLLWLSLKSVTESPSISLHGNGLMFGKSNEQFSSIGNYPNSAQRFMSGYLDLEPTGSIGKQIHWDSILRFGTSALPLTGMVYQDGLGFDYLTFRKISIEFSPDFMTATIGDFNEAYTPLTLWNRNNLDLYYKPEPVARFDDRNKYESFFNEEPAWPFRGLRLGTAIGWPDSDIMDRFSISTFAHMIRAGFNDYGSGGWLFNSNGINLTNYFPDFIFAGQAELRTKKLYSGDISLQASLKAYGVIMDEFLDPTGSGPNTVLGTPPPFGTGPQVYVYSHYAPNSWAHQYRIGSIRPELKLGLGGDAYVGVQYEGAFSSYQDDKTDQARTISDFAILASPYLQIGDSKVTFSYLNVGPYYYSPLAQTRQDTYPGLPGLFVAPLHSLFFLSNVPRPSGIFGVYDRTQDNVFPYGMSTPNRQGVGLDFDIKALKENALKIKGSAYLLQEITGNLVVNQAGATFTGLDTLPNGKVPIRKFDYLNIGPSYDLGPAVGLKTPLEIGANIRWEQTNSIIGNLTDVWILAGVRAGIFPWWEVSVAYGTQNMNGTDSGFTGTTFARYSYLFDNTDLGSYSLFNVNGSVQNIMWSSSFIIDRNSTAHIDYDMATATNIPSVSPLTGSLYDQFIGADYEIKF